MRNKSAITIKFTAKKYRPENCAVWRRQLPAGEDRWGDCRFVFDQDARSYDWLVVCDDLAPSGGERFPVRTERLACPRQNTLLLTGEPSPVKVYSREFVDQFGVILTSQEPWALGHPRAVYTHTGLPWYYGRGAMRLKSYEEIRDHSPERKTRIVSTVCSNKRKSKTLQRERFRFTARLEQALPELERFGRGVRALDDKTEALDPYAYHVAVENHIAPHYWTEKLADAFLGLCLPFYCGCPNAAQYFPEESIIPIDLHDFEGAVATIRAAIETDQWTRRLPALREARRRVLEEHNLFALIAREVEARHDPARSRERGAVIYSRRALRRKHPRLFWRDGYDRVRAALRRAAPGGR